ncbi:hypothetical protein PaG_02216 [Moesziomyces aphidis]|uniref:Uncharacterized protein n=1 Tax=Moesziomyces aphidis TaxID=84754 RepID=W3VSX5_MOEAP|nr:hypothetical protein PaG_02216 [Moesziomyces aphidis]
MLAAHGNLGGQQAALYETAARKEVNLGAAEACNGTSDDITRRMLISAAAKTRREGARRSCRDLAPDFLQEGTST